MKKNREELFGFVEGGGLGSMEKGSMVVEKVVLWV